MPDETTTPPETTTPAEPAEITLEQRQKLMTRAVQAFRAIKSSADRQWVLNEIDGRPEATAQG